MAIPKRRRPTLDILKKKIDVLTLLIEFDIDSQSYREVKDEIISDIAQLEIEMTVLQNQITHLNKVAETLVNLDNSDPESRRLARYDYVKMNLTPSIELDQVERDLVDFEITLKTSLKSYESKARKLEQLLMDLNNSYHSPPHKFSPNNHELDV